MRYFCIIPAAGIGERFGVAGVPKQYQLLQGTPVITCALRPFIESSFIEQVVVVLNAQDKYFSTTEYGRHAKTSLAVGGATRMDSVRAGLVALQDLAAPDDYVLVHDAARPFLTIQDLSHFVEAIGNDAVGGIFAQSVTDTLKFSEGGLHAERTEPRSCYFLAQTPQMFRFDLLSRALAEAKNFLVTDESEAVERLGYQPKLIEGPLHNIKITFATQL